MSNFQFLQPEWRSLHEKVTKAEERVHTEPVFTARYCRQALEEVVHSMYHLECITMPYNTDLVNLTTNPKFKQLIPYPLIDGLHIIRKTGNNASHYGKRVTTEDARTSIRYLFDVLKWFSQNYSQEVPDLPRHFDESFILKVGAKDRKLKEIQEESERVQQELQQQLEEVLANNQLLKEQTEANELLRRSKHRNYKNYKLESSHAPIRLCWNIPKHRPERT